MKFVTGPDGTLRADRTPTYDHPNRAEYIAVLRHVQRPRGAMNTQQAHPIGESRRRRAHRNKDDTAVERRRRACQALSEA